LPWAQVNSWNYWRHPWLLGDELKPVFTAYARLRYRLLPYLYSVAWDAHTTGMPMMRAMPLEFPEDRQTFSLIRQYMLGPALLVGAFTKCLYLPEGEWFDFWTGQKATGPKTFEPSVPSDRGGPLFVRAGSMIPTGGDMDYVGQKPDDELTVHVYAGADGRFVLYEDDGQTFEFERGAFRTTEIRQTNGGGRLSVEVAAAVGSFPGAPARRKVQFQVFGVPRPSRVHLDGVPVQTGAEGPSVAWCWDEATQSLTVRAGERDVNAKTTLSVE
ncbi:MAG: DUF5110 domain-containing protein, partial [Planctomycetes bacterium]|nr:DUF5110 domain-containing protein [Planctomycetota bacterium]